MERTPQMPNSASADRVDEASHLGTETSSIICHLDLLDFYAKSKAFSSRDLESVHPGTATSAGMHGHDPVHGWHEGWRLQTQCL